MKVNILLFGLFLLGITIAFSSMDTQNSIKGPHGGRVQKAENFNIETKDSYPYFYAYLLNEQLKPLGNKGMACEIKFNYNDSTSLDFPLKPYNDDGFSIESAVSDYNSYRITFHAFGRTVSAKFDNENAVVRTKD
jgi:hypothetical protein